MSTNDDFKKFMIALGVYAETLNKQLIESNDDGITLSRKQGRTQSITRLLSAIASAPENLKAYNSPRS